jgi:serine/threonine-protein kinase
MNRPSMMPGLLTLAVFCGAGCSESPVARDARSHDGLLDDGRPRDGNSPPPGDGRLLADGAAGHQDGPGASWTGYFPPQSVWYQDHSSAKPHPSSSAIISWLEGAGGWGGGEMRIDFSIEVLRADAATPMKSFTPTDDFYTPDCDAAPVPVLPGGALEGEDGYACTNDGDCHLIVVHPPSMKLYEMWRANIVGGTFNGGCLAVWDMTRVYGPQGRGDMCTSADAAGFPIAPLLFSADEVKAGAINHAIRFILPNSRIRKGILVRPATHSTNATTGGADAPQYGVHLRLKGSFDLASLKPGAQVVARALQKHGMFLADGGTIALTAQSDRFTQAKWAGLLEADHLTSLKVTDFEVVDHGPDIAYTGDCVREP